MVLRTPTRDFTKSAVSYELIIGAHRRLFPSILALAGFPAKMRSLGRLGIPPIIQPAWCPHLAARCCTDSRSGKTGKKKKERKKEKKKEKKKKKETKRLIENGGRN